MPEGMLSFFKETAKTVYFANNSLDSILDKIAQVVEMISGEDVFNVDITQASLQSMIGRQVVVGFRANYFGIEKETRFVPIKHLMDLGDLKDYFIDGTLKSFEIKDTLITLTLQTKDEEKTFNVYNLKSAARMELVDLARIENKDVIGTALKMSGRQIKVHSLNTTVVEVEGKKVPPGNHIFTLSKNILVDNATDLRGGIDFAQSNLDMQIKRDGAGIVLPVNQQDLENIKIDGLVPEILSVQPAASSPLFNNIGITTQ